MPNQVESMVSEADLVRLGFRLPRNYKPLLLLSGGAATAVLFGGGFLAGALLLRKSAAKYSHWGRIRQLIIAR